MDHAERVSAALERHELENRLRDAGASPRERVRRTVRLPLWLGPVRRLARLTMS
jgi:hypothetical protein